jgi:hypothetical protein
MKKSPLFPCLSLFGWGSWLRLWIAAVCVSSAWAQMPDTTVNRYATAADAAWWPTVNQGDYIFFKGNNDSNASIYSTPTNNPITLPLGKKILIWQGSYKRIHIDGTNCASTASQPTIVTNLGGQVKWGYNTTTSQYRGLELALFANVFLTGKYDPVAKTGDPNYLGHNGGADLGSGNYYERYGFQSDQRWTGTINASGNPNCVRIHDFQTCKVNYVAAWGDGFAGFNIKTDLKAGVPPAPTMVTVDVQDCFAGFVTGEGFYIGNTATDSSTQDFIKVTLRNNIVVCAGTEAYQTNNLLAGSVIENNVGVGSAMFFRTPFQYGSQQGLQQIGFMEGGVTVRKNILTGGGDHQWFLQYCLPGTRFSALGLTPSTAPFLLENNYMGFGRRSVGYIHPASDGATPYQFLNNVFGPLSVPHTNDADNYGQVPAGLDVYNSINSIALTGNHFNPDLPAFYMGTGNGSNLTESGSVYVEAPVLRFKNLGFSDGVDLRRITFWAAQYNKYTDKLGQNIPYQQGDIVYYYNTQAGATQGETRFFQCVATHTVSTDPNTSPALWQQLTWGGRSLPPLDVRMVPNTYYNYRAMGLTYNESNTTASDLISPVITLNGGNQNILKGSTYTDPGYTATDNKDGTLTGAVVASWIGPAINTNVVGEYYRSYRVTDAAGNVSLPTTRVVIVSDPNVTISRKAQVNMSQNSAVTAPGWTNVGNNTAGIVNNPDATTVGTTNTNIFDVSGVDTGWDLTIVDDPNPGTVSEHFGRIDNASSPAIGEFPAAVTKQGLQIRDPGENPCRLVFTNLNPAKYYDFRYTGYKLLGTEPNVPRTAELYDLASGRGDAVNVMNNTSAIGVVHSVKPDASGQIILVLTTSTPYQTANLSGLVIEEKSGFGYFIPAVFQQDFQASTNYTTYFNASSPTSGQFNDIGMEALGGTWSINASNQLQLVRTGGSGTTNGAGFTRFTDFATTPSVLCVRFDFGVTLNSTQNDLMTLDIGNITAFSDYNNGLAGASLFNRLNIDGAGSNNFRFEIGGVTSATYSANGTMYTLAYFLNKSGSTQAYLAPDGATKSLSTNCVAFWAGTTCLFDNVAASAGASSALTDLRVRFGTADTGTWKFDNFVVNNAF